MQTWLVVCASVSSRRVPLDAGTALPPSRPTFGSSPLPALAHSLQSSRCCLAAFVYCLLRSRIGAVVASVGTQSWMTPWAVQFSFLPPHSALSGLAPSWHGELLSRSSSSESYVSRFVSLCRHAYSRGSEMWIWHGQARAGSGYHTHDRAAPEKSSTGLVLFI